MNFQTVNFPDIGTVGSHTIWDHNQDGTNTLKQLAWNSGIELADLVCSVEIPEDRIAVVTKENKGNGELMPAAQIGLDGLITDENRTALWMLQSDSPVVCLYEPCRRVIGLVRCEKGALERAIQKICDLYGTDAFRIEAWFHGTPDVNENLKQWLLAAGLRDDNMILSDCITDDETDASAALLMIDIDDNDYRTWKQMDYRYNLEEAWDAEHYPDADYRYVRQVGCFVVTLAIMMRRFGIEKESRFEKFNPWIFLERAKEAGCFDRCADFDPYLIRRLYPVIYCGDVPYSREKLIECMDAGYLCMVATHGILGEFHYITVDEILDDDIISIDCAFAKKYFSEYSEFCFIALFRKDESVI